MNDPFSDTVVVFNNDGLGHADEALRHRLAANYLRTLGELGCRPPLQALERPQLAQHSGGLLLKAGAVAARRAQVQRDILRYFKVNEDFVTALLPIGDGLLLASKRV